MTAQTLTVQAMATKRAALANFAGPASARAFARREAALRALTEQTRQANAARAAKA